MLALPAAAEMTEEERAAILAPTTDFSVAERHEHLSGGLATNTRRFDREAFSQPSQNMSFEARGDFFVGNGFFKRLWVTAPSSTTSADGLGPLFNARACQRCHLKDGRGHPPANADDNAVSMFLRLSIPPQTDEQKEAIANHLINVVPEPTYGGQLQDIAIPGHAAEGRLTVEYEDVEVSFADGATVVLRQPSYSVVNLGYGPLHEDALISPRVASPMIGLGLLEAISEEDILAAADPDDADGDGISGTAKYIWSRGQERVMLARFGWKLGNPTIEDQSSEAMAGDIGISNPLFPQHSGDCTASQRTCLEAPAGIGGPGGDLEASAQVMDKIFFYSRHLAVPARRNVDAPAVLRGKQLFYEANCTSCHTPKHATRNDDGVDPALRGQLIWPFTDLLLHDMGDGLADGRPEGTATGSEWRTPPLWGIGLTEKVNGHTFFLHDGRARNLTEAILWHGYQELAAESSALTAALDTYCAAPDVEGRADVENQFHRLMDAWQSIQIIQFGPVHESKGTARFQFWPDKRGTGQRQLRNVLNNQDESVLEPGALGQKSVALGDLQALEYVLFNAPEALSTPDSFACRYAQAIARHQTSQAAELVRLWQNGGYRDQIVNAASGTDAFFDEAEAAGRFLNSLAATIDVVRLQKLDRPMGLTLSDARPKRTENWRSARSLRNVKLNMESVRLFLTVDDGFGDLLKHIGKEATALEAEVLVAEIINDIESFDQSLSDIVEDADVRSDLESLLGKLRSLESLVRERLAPELGLVPGFNATDGD
eukprot:s1_g2376.t1